MKIKPDDDEMPDFKPGQFVTLGLPKDKSQINPNSPALRRGRVPMIRRAYSISSSPKQKDGIELYIVLVPHGKLTTKLWDLDEGDRLFMDDRINGHFTLDNVEHGKNIVMISTGTGLAPFVSMLRTFQSTGRWNKVAVLHGVRYAQDLGYRDELEAMASADETITYIPTVTREPETNGYAGQRGRVNVLLEDDKAFEQLAGFKLDAATTEVMMCGNPAMIETVTELLEARGFVEHTKDQNGNIHFERYW